MAPVYEKTLDDDTEWALSEGSRYFDEKGAVHATLREIASRLEGAGIPYAIVGGMALFLHGFRRFTEDVDVLVTAEGLKAIHEKLVGLGYVPLYQGSKNLRDASSGVRVEFLVTGGFPGDGKPKPVSFPDPGENFVDKAGIRCLPLAKILELKLASGMSSAGRLKDLADVQELIRHLNLPREMAGELDLSVRDKYVELWTAVNQDTPLA
ncbi:MAG: hypothetical protein EXS05_16065 [Planctomycetaceae bacterium]|nr:hypothetical protein [Planctomycetaceae bacterium]